MNAIKAKIDQSSVTWNTDSSNERVRSTVAMALLYATDPRKATRCTKEFLCIPCYYNQSRIGGAAITHRECGICEAQMSFANTNTDVICKECAEKHFLCKHCGADVKGRARRKYPDNKP